MITRADLLSGQLAERFLEDIPGSSAAGLRRSVRGSVREALDALSIQNMGAGGGGWDGMTARRGEEDGFDEAEGPSVTNHLSRRSAVRNLLMMGNNFSYQRVPQVR